MIFSILQNSVVLLVFLLFYLGVYEDLGQEDAIQAGVVDAAVHLLLKVLLRVCHYLVESGGFAVRLDQVEQRGTCHLRYLIFWFRRLRTVHLFD